MYLSDPTFAAVTAFVLGYDLATEGAVLCGFREWLITRLGFGNNLAWPVLVLHAVFPGVENPSERVSQDRDIQEAAVTGFFDLLTEFENVRDAPEGLRRIFLEYERWLRSQDWYTPDSPQWIAPSTRSDQG